MKTISIVLIAIGMVLIVFGGILYVQPNLFGIFDTKPPTILYTFPYDGFAGQSSEVVVYIIEGHLSGVVYYDENNPNGLALAKTTTTPDHSIWIPDFTNDATVDQTDVDLLELHYGTVEGDPDWDPKYDIAPRSVPDGKINWEDARVMVFYVYTYTYRVDYTFTQGTYNFIIYAIDTAGNSKTVNGQFTILSGITELGGTWYISTTSLENNDNITSFANDITLKFISNEDVEALVKLIIDGTSYDMTKTTTKTWTKTLTISGTKTIQLVATTVDYAKTNSIQINISTPEISPLNYMAILILGIGTIMVVAGVVTNKEKNRIF